VQRTGLFLLTLIGMPFAQADAQSYDILDRSPRTAIYIETAYTGNEDRPGCDWYAAADDYLDGDSRIGHDCTVSIRLRGVINRDGAFVFSDIVKRAEELGHSASSLVLDSRGGDADAAISMAKIVRESAVFSAVPVIASVADGRESVCFSACVVLLSAAYDRVLDFDIDDNPELPSRIGIHGPGQFDRGSGGYDTSATNSEIMRVSRRLKDYFASIGVNERLVDDMFAVPFDQIRLLSREELVDYGLYSD